MDLAVIVRVSLSMHIDMFDDIMRHLHFVYSRNWIWLSDERDNHNDLASLVVFSAVQERVNGPWDRSVIVLSNLVTYRKHSRNRSNFRNLADP